MIEQGDGRIREGEILYREFWKKFSEGKSFEELYESGFIEAMFGDVVTEGPLRAVFLGVAPSTLQGANLTGIEFDDYGLKKIGSFVYNEEFVNQVIVKNEDIFGESPVNLEQLFLALSQARGDVLPEELEVYDLKVGLLLGFPRSACENAAKTTLFQEVENVGIQVGNVAWGNISKDEEDKKNEKILRVAFDTANEC